jgi:hypothetical protein
MFSSSYTRWAPSLGVPCKERPPPGGLEMGERQAAHYASRALLLRMRVRAGRASVQSLLSGGVYACDELVYSTVKFLSECSTYTHGRGYLHGMEWRLRG